MQEVTSTGLNSTSLSPDQVSAVLKDKELRSLRPGSDEYASALAKKFPVKATTPTESATVVITKTESANNDVSSSGDATGDSQNDDEAAGLSNRAKKRIDTLRARQTHIETENARLKAELEALKSNGKQPEKTATNTPQPSLVKFDKPKPVMDQFTTVSDFQEALTDWKFEKREFDQDQGKREQKSGSMLKKTSTLSKITERSWRKSMGLTMVLSDC